MRLSTDQMTHLTQLARLRLSDDEIEQFARELRTIIDYFDQLQAVDTDGVESAAHVAAGPLPLRPDTVRPSLPRNGALANAPDSAGEYVRVPRVIG